MNRLIPILLAACAACFAQNVERKTFSGVRYLVVDNVFGNVEVEGVASGSVEMEATRTEKRSSSRNAEVKLETRQEGDKLTLLVDGPFRCKCGDGSIRWRGSDSDDFHVRYDFKLRVPRDIHVELKTINDGDVRARNLAGPFKARNVNGGIDLARVSGSGEAHTVNGKVNVDFAQKPAEPCSFKSVNGKLTVTGPLDFGADVKVKTLNGEILTDYETSALPVAGQTGEKRGTRWVYKSNSASLRVGSGGPDMRFETVNGDIVIRKAK